MAGSMLCACRNVLRSIMPCTHSRYDSAPDWSITYRHCAHHLSLMCPSPIAFESHEHQRDAVQPRTLRHPAMSLLISPCRALARCCAAPNISQTCESPLALVMCAIQAHVMCAIHSSVMCAIHSTILVCCSCLPLSASPAVIPDVRSNQIPVDSLKYFQSIARRCPNITDFSTCFTLPRPACM